MAGTVEVGAVIDCKEDLCCGLDADLGHTHQDLAKREIIEHFLDLFGNGVALLFECFDVCSELGNY